LIQSARDVGFILKCPTFRRGEMGVNCLARVYGPGVWEGSPNSMCSLRRQMEKFHLTKGVPLSPVQKLFEKSLSFDLTDRNTPIIGKLTSRVLSLSGNMVSTNQLSRWGDEFTREDQYPNYEEEWMEIVARMELPLTNFNEFESWVETCRTLDELLSCPVLCEQGREFSYDDWDPEHGLLIARTCSVLGFKPVKSKNDGTRKGSVKSS